MNSGIEKRAYQGLVDSGVVPPSVLDPLFQRSEHSDSTFSQLVVKEKVLKEEDLLQIYSKHFNIPFIRLKNVPVDKALIGKIPAKFAWYYKFFPVSLQDRKLTVAVSRLLDIRALDEMRFGLGFEIEPNLTLESDIEEALKKQYGVGSDTLDRMMSQGGGGAIPASSVARPDEEAVQDLEKLAETASVVQLVNQIILEAYRKRASDIHLEPFQGRFRLRYRIDGVLTEAPVPAEMNRFFAAILSRIKIMANLNIVERRLPQDGKARVKVQQDMIDLRVSSIPTPYGESMVVRILPNQKFLTLDQLGFEPDQLRLFTDLIAKPYGIIFVTGPTGSGKSTTLNSALNVLNRPERKIITIEDPVEYDIPGVTQIQVQPEIGLTFARGLRSVLRHDPDVMMVGEVRDFETADIAIRIALTGHLILSTLHTNDAASGVTRLLDIGVEPYLVASSVLAFTAQRLVRTICLKCKEEDQSLLPEMKGMIRKDLGLGLDQPVQAYRGRGCDECNGTGYQGRMAVQEFLVLDQAIRQLILERVTSEEIKKRACEKGMVSLRQDGWKKVLKGLTTIDEVIRVTPADHSIPVRSGTEEDWFSDLEAPRSEGESAANLWVPEKNQDASFVEKRKFMRVAVHFRILFRVIAVSDENTKPLEHESADYDGTINDISAGGVCFFTQEEVRVGDILELRIGLPDEEAQIQCISRVLRVAQASEQEPKNKSPLKKVATLFLAINSKDRQRIDTYCRKSVDK